MSQDWFLVCIDRKTSLETIRLKHAGLVAADFVKLPFGWQSEQSHLAKGGRQEDLKRIVVATGATSFSHISRGQFRSILSVLPIGTTWCHESESSCWVQAKGYAAKTVPSNGHVTGWWMILA
ncbi:unnamed protein product [Cylindrotheca closterium]|uniref:Uncharacterized protein n=1 Tax=Cylindrotheca closterium TaxID=2856 RepID=A0AAD2G4V5_9STRA|nr:unnamed protein product [Cylindrotheca closterium]